MLTSERMYLNNLVYNATSKATSHLKILPLPKGARYFETEAYRQRLKQAVADMIAKPFAAFREPLAFTLLIRKAAHDRSGFRVDAFEAQKTLRRLWNGYNKAALRSTDYKRAKRLPLIAFMEKSADDRLHYHAVTDTPVGLLKPLVEQVLTQEWEECALSVGEPHFAKGITDSGWLGYMIKPRTKDRDDPTGGLDLHNYYPDRFDGPLREGFTRSLSGFKEWLIWEKSLLGLDPKAFEGFL